MIVDLLHPQEVGWAAMHGRTTLLVAADKCEVDLGSKATVEVKLGVHSDSGSIVNWLITYDRACGHVCGILPLCLLVADPLIRTTF